MSDSGGKVFWITGLSGAGKSSVAQLLARRLRERGQAVVHLDGDVIREVLGLEKTSYDREDRKRLAGIYGRLCRAMASQGIDVICATISMFHDVRRWNRKNIPGYREI